MAMALSPSGCGGRHQLSRWEAGPGMSCQIWHWWALSRRSSGAGRRGRRGRLGWATGPPAARQRWACPGDFTPGRRRTRWRVGWRALAAVPKRSSELNALPQSSAQMLLTRLHRVTFVLRRFIASVLQLWPRPDGDTRAWQAYHDAQRRAAPAGHPAQGGRASASQDQGERS